VSVDLRPRYRRPRDVDVVGCDVVDGGRKRVRRRKRSGKEEEEEEDDDDDDVDTNATCAARSFCESKP